eukprot:5798788-Amphidinium_carterae.1
MVRRNRSQSRSHAPRLVMQLQDNVRHLEFQRYVVFCLNVCIQSSHANPCDGCLTRRQHAPISHRGQHPSALHGIHVMAKSDA